MHSISTYVKGTQNTQTHEATTATSLHQNLNIIIYTLFLHFLSKKTHTITVTWWGSEKRQKNPIPCVSNVVATVLFESVSKRTLLLMFNYNDSIL